MKPPFRATSTHDALAVAEFLRRIFDVAPSLPFISPEHLHWKCWEDRSDWAGSRGYVLSKDGVMVAHGTVVPLWYLSGQKRLKMVHLIDWAAEPTSVGSGVMLLKQIMHMVDGVIVVGGSEMTQKVLPAVGFKIWEEVTRFARPLRPLRRLVGQKPNVRVAARFGRSLLWSLRTPSPQTQGWTATRIAPEQLRSQKMRWPRANNGTVVFERTNESIAYYLKCPVTPIELYSVEQEGLVRGYFLLAQALGQARIIDFYVDSEDPAHWCALIQLAVSNAKRNPTAVEIVSFGSDSVTRQALFDCGFHARGSSALRVSDGRVELRAKPIRFQMIDSDAAYLHANKNVYWA